MTIIEQIVAGLQTKFPGVDKAILTRIATKKGEGVTEEDKVNSIVEGIGFQDVLQSNSDFRANEAALSAIANYEKKHGIKDGKPVAEPPEEKPKESELKDDLPEWAKTLIDSNKSLTDELAAIKAEKNQATRQEQIFAKAKEYGIPEKYIKRCAIKDDEDLDSYMKDLQQDFKNDGFKESSAPETGEQKMAKENESIAEEINKGTKEIVGQNKE